MAKWRILQTFFGITIVKYSYKDKTNYKLKSYKMKNSKQTVLALLFGVITFFAVNSSYAQDASTPNTNLQTEDNLYVVVQRSDMCKMCEESYDRWNKEVIGYYSGRPSIVFMNYDITNEKTIESTKADIDKYGITELVNANKRPGRVLLIDPTNKQIVKMLDIDLSTTDMRNYINEAAPMQKNAKGIK